MVEFGEITKMEYMMIKKHKLKFIVCFFKNHKFIFTSGINDIHGTKVTEEFECVRCGKTKVEENDNFEPCNCEECSD